MDLLYIAAALYIPAVMVTGCLVMFPIFCIKEAIENAIKHHLQNRRH